EHVVEPAVLVVRAADDPLLEAQRRLVVELGQALPDRPAGLAPLAGQPPLVQPPAARVALERERAPAPRAGQQRKVLAGEHGPITAPRRPGDPAARSRGGRRARRTRAAPPRAAPDRPPPGPGGRARGAPAPPRTASAACGPSSPRAPGCGWPPARG